MPDVKSKSFWELAWEALSDTTLIILIVAAIVSLIFGLTLSNNKSTDWIEGATCTACATPQLILNQGRPS